VLKQQVVEELAPSVSVEVLEAMRCLVLHQRDPLDDRVLGLRLGVESIAPTKSGIVIHYGQPVVLPLQSSYQVRADQVHMHLLQRSRCASTHERMRCCLGLGLDARNAVVVERPRSWYVLGREPHDGFVVHELA
jgi:hypothetical protein